MSLEKQAISRVSRGESIGIADIAAKKTKKHLTFDYCCVRKMCIMKDDYLSRKRRYIWHF